MKNIIRLDKYYSPDDLVHAIFEFVDYCKNKRYHESLKNLTPADVYFREDRRILKKRHRIKEKTLRERRRNHIAKRLELTYETF